MCLECVVRIRGFFRTNDKFVILLFKQKSRSLSVTYKTHDNCRNTTRQKTHRTKSDLNKRGNPVFGTGTFRGFLNLISGTSSRPADINSEIFGFLLTDPHVAHGCLVVDASVEVETFQVLLQAGTAHGERPLR